MSHFYGNMQGSRGETTRCGTKQSGIWAHTRGWNVGVYVSVNHVNGKDICCVYRTKGSNGSSHGKLIAKFEEPTDK